MIVRYFEAGLAQANGLMWRIGGASLVLVPDQVQLKVRGGLGLASASGQLLWYAGRRRRAGR
jgi:hypothetical protein